MKSIFVYRIKIISGLVMLALGIASRANALSLTGITQFSTDASGNIANIDFWNTLPNSNTTPYKLWVTQGDGLNNSFINGPTQSQSSINIPLSDGIYNFTVFGEPGATIGSFGINLFFNGLNNIPKISAYAQAQTNLSTVPSFTANGGSNTYALDNTYVAGANSLSFVDGLTTVTLTSYRFAIPNVYNLDRISGYTTTPNSQNDYILQFTLQVSGNNIQTPEPSSTLSLIVFSLGGILFIRRRMG